MLQVKPAHGVPHPPSGGGFLQPSYGANNASFDETNSIISLYGNLYAPSLISEAESVTISGSMPPGKVLVRLSRHGCEDLTHALDPRSVSKGVVSTGGSGDVYRGALHDGRRVGVKCLRVLIGMDEEGEKQVKRAARELYIWSKCKHENIQELLGMALYNNRVAMVSPWMKNGNLSWYISRNPDVDRHNLMVQVAAAVAYLRENGVVHGDIKAQNFLVSEDHIVKLTDFGSSFVNHCSLKFTATTSTSGMTLRWTAPEIFLGDTQHTYEGDVYALGMTILEIISGSMPWDGMLDVTVMHNLIQKAHPSRPETCLPIGYRQSDRLWELMTTCWASEPRQRPRATKVRDELETINKQHHSASSTDASSNQSLFDTQNSTESSFVQTSIQSQPPTPVQETRSKPFWKRSRGLSGQTTNQDSTAQSGTGSVDKIEEKKQRRLEVLERRKIQEERARASAKGVMAKRELELINGNFAPGDWTDPNLVTRKGRAAVRMRTHPIPGQPVALPGGQEPRSTIGAHWRRPYAWDETSDGQLSDRRRFSTLSFATVGSDPGPRRPHHPSSMEAFRGSSVSLQGTSSTRTPRSARSLASFERFVHKFSTQARIEEDPSL
ncbi:Serine/threonine-protein kinase BUR1 [Yarrowia lipolytica CLIB122] [Rhizoctonia solani]|uniref:Serine/threonine-protein kinase BUR1 [Yarrowia lipolytica CLIB122] n=1 Tax=Rhizoctonia solani TaxID=456999 RepID=A0A0K6FQY3_9AGAM|nr:Serine/threonine-protein kinase BUR1 [Yarrowia lipolytica CLIB122] [Rhizoctonia solani]